MSGKRRKKIAEIGKKRASKDPAGLQSWRTPFKIRVSQKFHRLSAKIFIGGNPSMIAAITRLQLNWIKKRVSSSHGVPFEYSDAVVDTIVSLCQELESDGRMIDAIVTNTMLPDISAVLLRRMMEGKPVSRAAIDVADGNFVCGFE